MFGKRKILRTRDTTEGHLKKECGCGYQKDVTIVYGSIELHLADFQIKYGLRADSGCSGWQSKSKIQCFSVSRPRTRRVPNIHTL